MVQEGRPVRVAGMEQMPAIGAIEPTVSRCSPAFIGVLPGMALRGAHPGGPPARRPQPPGEVRGAGPFQQALSWWQGAARQDQANQRAAVIIGVNHSGIVHGDVPAHCQSAPRRTVGPGAIVGSGSAAGKTGKVPFTPATASWDGSCLRGPPEPVGAVAPASRAARSHRPVRSQVECCPRLVEGRHFI